MLDTSIRIIMFWWQNTGEAVIEEGISISTCGLHIQLHKQDLQVGAHYTCISAEWGEVKSKRKFYNSYQNYVLLLFVKSILCP